MKAHFLAIVYKALLMEGGSQLSPFVSFPSLTLVTQAQWTAAPTPILSSAACAFTPAHGPLLR